MRTKEQIIMSNEDNNIIDLKIQAKSTAPKPRPLPESKNKVLPLNKEMLPNRLLKYTKYVSERMQCPHDFIVVSSLCSLASLLGNSVLVKTQNNSDWGEVPTLWGMLIGNSSFKKSPALKSALSPIHKIEKQMFQKFENDLEQYEAEKISFDLRMQVEKKNR